jgi:hypothetical protein
MLATLRPRSFCPFVFLSIVNGHDGVRDCDAFFGVSFMEAFDKFMFDKILVGVFFAAECDGEIDA